MSANPVRTTMNVAILTALLLGIVLTIPGCSAEVGDQDFESVAQ